VPRSWVEGFHSLVMRRGVPVGPNKKKTDGATKVLQEGSPWRKLGKLMDEAINTRLPWETKVDSKEPSQQEASLGSNLKKGILKTLPEGTARVEMPPGTAVYRLPDGTCKAFVPKPCNGTGAALFLLIYFSFLGVCPGEGWGQPGALGEGDRPPGEFCLSWFAEMPIA
jgi:hypothetical protein